MKIFPKAIAAVIALGAAAPALGGWTAADDERRRQMSMNEANRAAAERDRRASESNFNAGRYSPSGSSSSGSRSSGSSYSGPSGVDETISALMASIDAYNEARRKEVVDTMVRTEYRMESPEALAARIRSEAQGGDPFMQWTLGRMYNSGIGVGRDSTQAAAWFRKAAEQGDAGGQAALGDLYYSGTGVARDLAQAAQWWEKAARQGHSVAAKNAGIAYDNGWGVAKSEARAMELFRIAAQAGEAPAQLLLGEGLHAGRGVPKDEAQGCAWIDKAAQQGLVDAYFNNANCYFARNDGQGLVWLRKAAEAGDADAKYKLGLATYNGLTGTVDKAGGARMVVEAAPRTEQGTDALINAGNLLWHGADIPRNVIEAAAMYKRAGDRGDDRGWQALDEIGGKLQGAGFGQAEYEHAFTYLQGAQQEPAKAFAEMKQAAEAGNLAALVTLGGFHSQGIGTQQDQARAVYLWHLGSLLRVPMAARLYGLARMDAEGVEKDEKDGLTWVGRAAGAGDGVACNVMGQIYEKGLVGQTADRAKARDNYKCAVEAGVEEAREGLQRVSAGT